MVAKKVKEKKKLEPRSQPVPQRTLQLDRPSDLSPMRQKGKAILPLHHPLTECVLPLERDDSVREGSHLWQRAIARK